jgi:mono/diheme cytochrome c family protein
MKRSAFAVLLLLIAGPPHAFAQQARDGVTDQQRRGRQMLAQSCGVCHLPPARNARTYGPPLHKGSSGGDNAAMTKVILEGTPRMPAFKYFLQTADVDAIIAYVRTVPVPAAASASPRPAGPSTSPETADP